MDANARSSTRGRVMGIGPAPVRMLRSGLLPFRTTRRFPPSSTSCLNLRRCSSISASNAACSIFLAPSRTMASSAPMVSGVASIRVSMVVLLTDVLLPGGLVWRQNLTVKKRPFSIPSTRIDHISGEIILPLPGNYRERRQSAKADVPSIASSLSLKGHSLINRTDNPGHAPSTKGPWTHSTC